MCTDVRNALPDDGWSWLRPDDLADRTARWAEVAPGITGYWCEPQVGLGTTVTVDLPAQRQDPSRPETLSLNRHETVATEAGTVR